MNKVWFIITIVSIIFGIFNDKIDEMIDSLFTVPENVINSLFKIGSMLVIYNGLFNIAIESKCINKLSKLLNKRVNKIFKLNDSSTSDLISTSIICNMLGLGPANMPIAIKIIERLKGDKFNLSMYIFVNISSFCILPLSLIALRTTFNSLINVEFIALIAISSFITTIFAILLCKFIYRGKNDE